MTAQPLHVDLDTARDAFVAQAHAFAGVAGGLTELDLLAASRCHGWTDLEVVVHVRTGLEEMLRGCSAPTAEPATHDAAAYWTAFAAAEAPGDDVKVDSILWLRRTASAYRRPSSAVTHLNGAVDAVVTAAAGLGEGRVRFQGQVLTTGDFLATWAVELAVHQLDLLAPAGHPQPVPAALLLARRTVEALAGGPAPTDVDDTAVVLAGTGRIRRDDIPRVLG